MFFMKKKRVFPPGTANSDAWDPYVAETQCKTDSATDNYSLRKSYFYFLLHSINCDFYNA